MAKSIIARTKMYEIYLIEHIATGKKYVGCTSKGYENRIKQHIRMAFWRPATYLHRSIATHGVDAFSFSRIDTAESVSHMAERERYWIKELATLAPHGYNLTTGGESGFDFCGPIKAKLVRVNKGRVQSEETRKKKSDAMKGRKLSAEHRLAVSNARMGMKFSDSHKLSMSLCRIGRESPTKGLVMGDAQKQLLRESALKQWSDPAALAHISSVRKGRVVSEKTKAILTDRMNDRWADPEYKKRMAAIQIKAQKEIAPVHANRMKGKWADPEYRLMMKNARIRAKEVRMQSA